jgi:hypothetical protein
MKMHPGSYQPAASTSRISQHREEDVDILLIYSMLYTAVIIRNLIAVAMGALEQAKLKIAILAALWRRRPSTMIIFTVRGRQRLGLSRCGRPAFEPYFERRFRMPRTVYENLMSGVMKRDYFFHDSKKAAGVPSASPDQKVTEAPRILCYRSCADEVVEYVRLTEPLIS